jgi:hypothetical protein
VRSSFVGRSPPKTHGIATRARIPAEDTTSFTNTALERVSFANARIRADVATFAARSRRLSTAKNTLAQIDSKAVCCQAVPHAAGFGIAQLVSTAAWPIAILGSTSPGAGLVWSGYRLWHTPATSDRLLSERSTQMSTGASGSPVANPLGTPHGVRAIIQRLRSSAR